MTFSCSLLLLENPFPTDTNFVVTSSVNIFPMNRVSMNFNQPPLRNAKSLEIIAAIHLLSDRLKLANVFLIPD